MKKTINVISTILLLALLLSSCNMDSNTGLFQDAALSEKKESYTIHSVLAKDSNNNDSYLVASSDGVFLYSATGDNNSSKKYLTGNDAQEVIYAKIENSKWELVYYNEKENKWYKVTEEKTEELQLPSLNGKHYSSSYTDLNGNYAFVLKDEDNITNYVYYGKNPESLDFQKSKFTDVKYFGDGYFIGEDNNSKRYIFKPGDIDNKEISNKDAVATFGNNTNNYILQNGSIYIDDANKNTPSDSITDCSPLIHEEGDNIYIILKSTNNFYIYNKKTKTIETKECVGLKDVEIKAITGVKNNGESINVIIANSKARSINLKDKLLSDWIK